MFPNLHHVLWDMARRIEQLESEIRRLTEEVEQIKQIKPVQVEGIQYHFDQLKVEKLEGTLNIGITPESAGIIEDYAVQGEAATDFQFGEGADSETLYRIRNEIGKYLREESPDMIRSLQQEYHLPEDAEYMQRMITDMESQLDGRIRHYLKRDGDQGTDSMIIQKLKEDILAAAERHIQSIAEEESS